MKLRFVWIGKTRSAPIKELIREYTGRIAKFAAIEVTELRDRSDERAARIIEKEGEDLLSRTESIPFQVALE
jgi:23S rRNA pseudoU1915 N3-methylase RlmH